MTQLFKASEKLKFDFCIFAQRFFCSPLNARFLFVDCRLYNVDSRFHIAIIICIQKCLTIISIVKLSVSFESSEFQCKYEKWCINFVNVLEWEGLFWFESINRFNWSYFPPNSKAGKWNYRARVTWTICDSLLDKVIKVCRCAGARWWPQNWGVPNDGSVDVSTSDIESFTWGFAGLCTFPLYCTCILIRITHSHGDVTKHLFIWWWLHFI